MALLKSIRARSLRGLRSFRSRYLLGAALLSLLFAGMAFGGWMYVRSVTGGQLVRIEERTRAASAVDDLSDQVGALESQVQRFLIAPTDATRAATRQRLALQSAAWKRLAASEWVRQDPDTLQLLEALRQDLSGLHEQVETVLQSGAGDKPGDAVGNAASAAPWHAELLSLQQDIDPTLTRIEQRLSALELELNVGSARDIALWTRIAQQLTTFAAAVALLGIGAVVGTYWLFDRALFKPIGNITRALHAEASGSGRTVIPEANAREMAELIEAFNEMRRQVHTRQARLDHIAHHDSLTQLPNRALFRDRLEHALNIAERNNELVAVMFLDLDRFKQINDSLGHEFGDRLLLAASGRLLDIMRAGDTVARLGGDEFAVIAEGITHVDQVEGIAEKILGVFQTPFEVGGRLLHVTGSVGVALCPLDDCNADTLLRDADLAMYGAKELGRNTYRFFSADMTSRVKRNLELETELREAIAKLELDVHFQPIVDVRDGHICGCEALLRWLPAGRLPVAPGEFLPVLEETGLIVDVTCWILGRVQQLYALASQRRLRLETVSINLSARLLQSGSFMDLLTAALRDGGIPAHALILEITEDTLVQDFRSADAALNALKELGARVALDDFGTGQSSLNHLRGFPIDIVKVDRDFVRNVPHDRYDSDLVRAIIAMANSLGMVVVAEGVETPAQLEFLKAHGCHHVQGFLFGRPMSGDELLGQLGRASAWS